MALISLIFNKDFDIGGAGRVAGVKGVGGVLYNLKMTLYCGKAPS